MAPGLDGLPAAEREVEVSGPVAEFLGSVSPRVLSRIRLGLRAFELLPFPWRFSRLELSAREDFLRRMEGSRLGIHHELLLMGKVFATLGYAIAPEVEGRIGFEASCRLADGSEPEPGGSLGDTEPAGEGEECDVVIVGSGAGGAVAAATLAEAGLDVIVLEAGASFDRESYPDEPLEAIASLYRDGGLTIAGGRPQIPIPVGRAVGGTTVVNSGTCFRAPQAVLDDWRDRFGIDWTGDLDRAFAEAERFLRVTPLDPERMGRNGQLAMEGAAATACSAAPAPSAARSTPSAACTSATSPVPSPPEHGCAPRSKRARSWSRTAAPWERAAPPAAPAGARGPTRSAPAGRRSSPAAPWARRSCSWAPASAAAM
jgi:hypothetical protein